MNHRPRVLPSLLSVAFVLLAAGCASEGGGPGTGTVATPVISPGAGTYSAAIDVAITTATAGAAIRYTTDGSTPTETSGTLYAGPVHIAASMTVKAVAYRTDWTTSAVASAQITIAPLVAAPVFSPPAGEYIPAQDVTITTATDAASIRYTTDGSTPTALNGTVYTGPVHLAASAVLRAVAYRDGWTTSSVTTGEYLIGPLASAPVFDPPPGAYHDPVDVSITTATAGAAIRYTTDGTTPTETAGAVYTGPVHIDAHLTLRAVAYQAGWRTSAVTSGAYAIGPSVAPPAFSPGPGSFSSAQDVTITTLTPGSTIRYTTNGATPTETVGTIYAGPVRIAATATLRAVAYRSGWTASTVTSGEYVITGEVAGPEFDPPAGLFVTPRTVTITCPTAGATIRYTTDGSTPTETAGTVYASPVPIDRTTNLRAVATRAGWTTSSVTSGEYGRVGLSAGATHTLRLAPDGVVWAWGGNFHGQLGDGTTNPRALPAPVASLSGIIAVAAGSYHSAVLLGDGTVRAWGRNFFGQVGDGTTTERLEPVAVTGLTGVTAIAAGGGSTYAIRSDGTLWGWGDNNDGQLGDGTTTNRYVPGPVSGLTNVIAVAAGTSHALALRSDGTVWAWGNNLFGTLGDGTTDLALTPVQATGLTGAVAIGADEYHSAAVLSDGTVRSWGSGLYGELGIGSQVQVWAVPTQAVGVSGASAVEAGGNHTLILLGGGTALACGLNFYGQLGDGTNNPSLVAVPVTGLTGVIWLAAGHYHSAALLADGSVWTWGHNGDYELGDGTTNPRNAPVKIID